MKKIMTLLLGMLLFIGCKKDTVTIDTQTWTDKNLDVATYSDGTIIPQVTDPTEWANLTTGAWCYYDNSDIIGPVYGKLYNWYAVAGIWNEASKKDAFQRKKLAPTGYHVPSDEEWTILTTSLGGKHFAGTKMKETEGEWLTGYPLATNSSGFTGLAGGYRHGDGTFDKFRYEGNWWSSLEDDTTNARFLYMSYLFGDAMRASNSKKSGFSVRCLRD